MILTFSLARGLDLVFTLGVTTPLISPVMVLVDLVFLGKNVLICPRAKDLEIWKDFFQVRDDLIGSTLVDLCEIRFGGSLGCKLREDQ